MSTSMSMEDQEIALERLANEENLARIRSLKTDSGIANSPQGKSMVDRAVITLASVLENAKSLGSLFVPDLIGDWTAVALISTRHIMNEAFELPKRNTLARAAQTLGASLVDHLNFKMYRDNHPEAYMRTLRHQKLHSSGSYSHRERAILWAMGQTMGKSMITLPPDQLVHLGMKIIREFVEHCGLAIIHETFARGKRQNYLVPAPETLKYIDRAEAREALLSPILYPMITPPAPWVSWNHGGYLLNMPGGEIQTKFIRSSKLQNQVAHDHGLTKMYEAANYLGSIPWRINGDMLDTLHEAWNHGHAMVPKAETIPELPPKPWETDEEYLVLKERCPDVIKEWKRRASDAYNDVLGAPIRSARISILRCLHVADRVRGYNQIYFPHNVDFRGRVYPIPAWVNPQGVDHARGLLEFATPGAIEPTGAAWYWHCVIGANLFGFDKVSMNERFEWTQKHETQIAHSATDPLNYDWWHTADKPWQALAWCREHYKILHQGLRETRIVCHQDGSCNGIQHLSLATRDEIGGASVNLVPNPVRQDIYTLVAEEVRRILPADSKWLPYVTRKVCKRGTMTLGYGVTRFGIAEQLVTDLPGILEEKYDKETMRKTNDLAAAIDEASHRIVVKGKQLMEWYQQVARAFMDKGHAISWLSPLGMFVSQHYPKLKIIEIQTIQANHRLNVSVALEEPGQNKMKNVNAIAPNVTHSMDAAHMCATAIRCQTKGIKQYAGIHDSFGTTADNIQVTRKIILETLRDIYTDYNPIQVIQEQARRLNVEIPEPPAQGNLDIDLLTKCTYAFG